MNILKYLFAPRDTENYPASGMFNITHIISLIVCVVLIVIFIYLSKNIRKRQLIKLTKIFAIITTILEIIKIIYNFHYGYTMIDNWFPLAFCSLFIYALYMVGFSDNYLHKLGASFITGSAPICGFFFLICPTTSLMLHPIYHYLCIYSLFFHSSMIYFGIMFFKVGMFKVSIKNYYHFIIFCISFSTIALIINLVFKSNLMFYTKPYNMPLEFINTIYEKSQAAYTIIIFFAYALTYLIPMSAYYICEKTKQHPKIV